MLYDLLWFSLYLEFDIRFNPDTNTPEVKHGPSEVQYEQNKNTVVCTSMHACLLWDTVANCQYYGGFTTRKGNTQNSKLNNNYYTLFALVGVAGEDISHRQEAC